MILALALAAASQTTSPPPPTPPKVDCTDADHRAFDFWVGDWDVSAAGSPTILAHSRIEKIVGCAISETFDQRIGPGNAAIDYHGRSISAYDPAAKGWRQFYIDNSGTAATLDGGAANGAMVLISHLGPVTNRMTVTPHPGGTVSQRGDFSNDDGKTWSPAYDFVYRRRGAG